MAYTILLSAPVPIGIGIRGLGLGLDNIIPWAWPNQPPLLLTSLEFYIANMPIKNHAFMKYLQCSYIQCSNFPIQIWFWGTCQLNVCIIVYLVHWPPLRTRSGSGPLNSLMTIVMSDTMSRVGTKIQKVKIRIKSFLSNSAMTFEKTNNQGGPLVTEQEAKEKTFYMVHGMRAFTLPWQNM